MNKVRVLDIDEFEGDADLGDFYCNNFKDHLITHNKNISTPHKHNFFLTVLFTQGAGVHEIDFEKYTVSPGSVFMINPGQTHYWELSDDIDGIIFFHSQEFFDISFTKQSIYDFPFFYSVHNPSALFVNELDAKSFFQLFNQVMNEYVRQVSLSKQKIISLLNCIYIDIARLYLKSSQIQTVRTGVYSSYLSMLESLIEKNFKSEKSPAAYAEMLNITMRHLNRLTQETLNKSTTQLITERVILEAKRLIVYDSSALANISCELGYQDYAYFSRLFKKWTGSTPSDFAQLYKK